MSTVLALRLGAYASAVGGTQSLAQQSNHLQEVTADSVWCVPRSPCTGRQVCTPPLHIATSGVLPGTPILSCFVTPTFFCFVHMWLVRFESSFCSPCTYCKQDFDLFDPHKKGAPCGTSNPKVPTQVGHASPKAPRELGAPAELERLQS